MGSVRNTVDKLLLSNSLKEYPFLFENKVESKEHRITKIIDGFAYEDVLFHSGLKEFLLIMPDADYDRNNQGWKTFWKINANGKVIDSLNSRAYMNTLGVFLDSTSYIDWAFSGNKKRKEYKQIIDYDSLANSEFLALIEKAETVAYGNNYDKKTTNCYVKIDDAWFVLESKKAFASDLYLEPETFFKHKTKNKGSFITLKNQILPFQKWKDKNQFIYLQGFVAESRQFKSLLDINNHGRSGWNGTAYYRLNYESNTFYFKGYAFKGDSFSTDLSFFSLEGTSSADDSAVSFIIVRRNNNSRADIREKGVYLISKK